MDPERTATLLGDAQRARRPFAGLDDADRPRDLAGGYAVQAARFALLESGDADAPAGWKVGATTAAMQRYLGVDGPAYGRVAHRDVHPDGAEFPAADLVGPGIECEIAVRIGRNADARRYDRDSVAEIVGEILPAIELVENRYADFTALGAPTLVADNFFHRACVLGPAAGDWRSIDLPQVRGRTEIDGEERGAGVGADVMGHPLEVVAWLANALGDHGLRLRDGQVVLTGSVTPVIWLDGTACSAVVALSGLGEAGLRIA